VQRVAWTDERLDDLSRRMDAGFERVNRDVRELRGEIAGLRTEVRFEFGELRADVRSDISGLRAAMNRFGAGMILSMLGLIAAQALG
jgi:hypothetical protein